MTAPPLINHHASLRATPMRKHIILVLLIAGPALAACSAQDTVVSAYTSDEPTSAPAPAVPLDGTCLRVADTGDMYRYCMQYGPQQALAH
jgi:hypothetical protein